jgi:hypothetical protein
LSCSPKCSEFGISRLIHVLVMNRVGIAPSDSLRTVQLTEETTATSTRNGTRSFFAVAWFGTRYSSAVETWSKFVLHQRKTSAWRGALKIQTIVLRNALGSIACACVPNAFYAFGNIFSGESYLHQSRGELIVANSVWAAIAFCSVVLLSFLPLLLSLRFLQAPDRRPTVWFCLKRLGRATLVYFVGAVAAMFAFGCLAAYLANVQSGSYKYKLESYADNLSLLGYFTGITRGVKKIYYEETCQGRDRLLKKQLKGGKSAHISTHKSASKLPESTTFEAKPRYRTPTFWKAYLRNLPSATPPLLATAFVHILSRMRILDHGNGMLTGFVIGSILFKLSIQELAKHYVLKRHVRSTRVMCVLVGVPTVLIDTQTRIILLASKSTRTAVVGALGMAIIEVFLRVGKAKFVKWSISQRETILSRAKNSSFRQSSLRDILKQGIKAILVPPNRPSVSALHVEFEMWRRQVQAFHTAELNADMYAEYVAIGCSISIIFFFGNHPHYSLLRQSKEGEAELEVEAWRVNQLGVLGLHVAVEIVVDYVSIVLEMMVGIEFEHTNNLGSFLAALFMVTAVMNITISIGVYLS